MPPPDTSSSAARRPLVLIVDDMSIIREPIAHCLRGAGFDTAVAADTAEALAAVQSRAPDLLVLDIHLGHADGLDLLTQILRPPWPKQPARHLAHRRSQRRLRQTRQQIGRARLSPEIPILRRRIARPR